MALGIGMATQGWGTALAGSLGLTGTAAIAVEAGIATLCSKAGMSMLQNNLDPVQTAKDVARKETLLNVLESMATAGALHGITGAVGSVAANHVPGNLGAQGNATQAQQLAQATKKNMVEGLAGHFKQSLLTSVTRAAVHTGFEAAQGHNVNLSATVRGIATQTVANTLQATGANRIGGAALDPVLHKLLHGVLAGGTGYLLGGLDGAKAGAASAMIAETLAEVVKPSMMEAFAEMAADHAEKAAYDDAVAAYLNTQKNLLLLTTAGITAGLGLDVDTAITTADNALSHNMAQSAAVLAQGVFFAGATAGGLTLGAGLTVAGGAYALVDAAVGGPLSHWTAEQWQRVIDYVNAMDAAPEVDTQEGMSIADATPQTLATPIHQNGPQILSTPIPEDLQSLLEGMSTHNGPDTSILMAEVQRIFVLYGKASAGNAPPYIGRTSGMGDPTDPESIRRIVRARDRNHHMNAQGFYPAEPLLHSTNPDAIRGQEQIQIEAQGGAQSQGGTSSNKINSISDNNPNAGQYREAAQSEFGS